MSELPPNLQPTPMPRLLGFWGVRVGIMTAIVVLWQIYGDPVPWLWWALIGYAAFSLGTTLLLERYRAAKAREMQARLDQLDPRGDRE